MIDNKQFEELWGQEERKGVLRRLQREYPAWQQRRRTALTAASSVAVVAVVAGITLSTLRAPRSTYDAVACNRSGIADGHWAEVAGNILILNCEF